VSHGTEVINPDKSSCFEHVLGQASHFSPFRASTTSLALECFLSLEQATSLIDQEAHHESLLLSTIL
jgi:hypothetical protein